jgi:hypothetical protein
MDSYVGSFTGSLINNVIKELKKKHNKEKIMTNIVDPLLGDLKTRYYPHFVTVTSMLIAIVVMLLVLLIVVLVNRNSCRCVKLDLEADVL